MSQEQLSQVAKLSCLTIDGLIKAMVEGYAWVWLISHRKAFKSPIPTFRHNQEYGKDKVGMAMGYGVAWHSVKKNSNCSIPNIPVQPNARKHWMVKKRKREDEEEEETQ